MLQIEAFAADCTDHAFAADCTLCTSVMACADLVFRIAHPLAILILVGIGAAVSGFNIATIGVFQLCGADWNLRP